MERKEGRQGRWKRDDRKWEKKREIEGEKKRWKADDRKWKEK